MIALPFLAPLMGAPLLLLKNLEVRMNKEGVIDFNVCVPASCRRQHLYRILLCRGSCCLY